MNQNKLQYIATIVVPELKSMGVTKKQLITELDYRAFCGVKEPGIGWDDDLYQYSTDELKMIEQVF